jgi:hypothetical protein
LRHNLSLPLPELGQVLALRRQRTACQIARVLLGAGSGSSSGEAADDYGVKYFIADAAQRR